MNFEDLTIFYAAFKNLAEIDQVIYWIVKYPITRDHYIQLRQGLIQPEGNEKDPDIIGANDIIKYMRKNCGLQGEELSELSYVFN